MRWIAELPTPLRYLVYALLVLAAILLLHWLDHEDPKAEQRVPIHIKLRPGTYPVGHALFHHLPAQTALDDPRMRWERIEVPASQVAATLADLARDPTVEEAFVPPTITLPSAWPLSPHHTEPSCPIATPSFESYQGYLGAAPHGIDAPAAWRRGVRGQYVWFADVEGGWNAAHEDLPGDRMTHAGGVQIPDQAWRAHGTAVLGEVAGKDNGKGVVGIAPDVERIFTSSIGGTSVADAIDTAAEQLRPGDVLLIELQGGGPRGRYLPVEYWDDVYDAIVAATARGVVVIEAAGNGGENLDHQAYKGKLSRGARDSGAIMVGAGGPPRDGFADRERLDFSNYGSRVDVQGWGRKVATLDYGDLQSCDGPKTERAGLRPVSGSDRHYTDRHYTDEFSGTSSASPIVAGAAVLLESWARGRGKLFSAWEIRAILVASGTSQGGDRTKHIGPRPDLRAAFSVLE